MIRYTVTHTESGEVLTIETTGSWLDAAAVAHYLRGWDMGDITVRKAG